MKKCIIYIIYTGLIFLSHLFLSSEINAQKLPSIFTNGMVLQQNSEVAIWGTADINSEVKIITGWNQKTYNATSDADGNWQALVSTPNGGFDEYDIIIIANKTITINNVLIGEVWLSSGQSNMEMPVKGFLNQPIIKSMDILMEAENPYIRLFEVEKNSALNPAIDVKGNWNESNSSTVKEFSAIAFVFGKILFNKLKVPIGLIGSYWGGSSIDAWMSKKALENFSALNPALHENQLKAVNHIPTALYNGMIKPIQPYEIKGVIWYQGETDRNRYELYSKLFPDMIWSFRNEWGNENLSFYYVQIAPYVYDHSNSSALLREVQLQTVDRVPNVGMAVTLDIGEQFNIHPAEKITVAERLSYLALAKSYGVKGLPYSGPVYRSMEIKEDKVYLSFDYALNGLTTFGENLSGFKIAGDDKVFHDAEAKIISDDGNAGIMVWSDFVSTPKAVRYCFKDWCEGNLYNTIGLPASSFRTDSWDNVK